jgi:hypothetical protein
VRGRPELDVGVDELAAEAPADHARRGCKDRARRRRGRGRIRRRARGAGAPRARARTEGVERGPYWTVITPFMFIARCGVQW